MVFEQLEVALRFPLARREFDIIKLRGKVRNPFFKVRNSDLRVEKAAARDHAALRERCQFQGEFAKDRQARPQGLESGVQGSASLGIRCAFALRTFLLRGQKLILAHLLIRQK